MEKQLFDLPEDTTIKFQGITIGLLLQCLFSVLIALLLISESQAAVLNSVYSGTASSSGNGVVSVPIGATVDPATSFLIFSSRHSNNTPGGSMIRGEINGAGTDVVFTRATNQTNTIEIQWYVAEFSSGVSVQRGTVTHNTATQNIPITAVSSLSQAFVTWSRTPAAGHGDFSDDDPGLCELTTTNNLQCRAQAAGGSHQIAWQVIEFTNPGDINVQKGTIGPPNAMSGGTTLVNATIPTALTDINNAFILVGYTVAGGGADVGERMLRAQLTSTTNIQIDRSIAGDDIEEISWQVIEFFDGTTVQRGSENFAALSGTAGVMSWDNSNANRLAHAAISVATSGAGVGYVRENGATGTNTNTVSFNINGSNNNTNKLIVGTSVEENNCDTTTDEEVQSITYDGVNLTPITGITVPLTGFCQRVELWYLDNPSNGNDALQVTTNGPVENLNVVALMLSNAAAGLPENIATNSLVGPNTISTNINTLSNNAMLVDVVGSGNNSNFTATAPGQNERREVDGASSTVSMSTRFIATPPTPAETTNVVTLTAVDTTRAVAFASVQPVGGQNMGRTDYAGDDIIGVSSFTATLTSATQLTLQRSNASANADVGWFVVEFNNVATANIILSTRNNSVLGGQAIDQDEAVEYDASTSTGTLFLDDATFDADVRLNAIHAIDDGTGHLVISTAQNTTIGGNSILNGDLIQVSPAGGGVYNYVGVLFSEGNFMNNSNPPTAGTGNENIDAVYIRNNGNIVFSTTSDARVNKCNPPGPPALSFNDAEIVEWDPGAGCATSVFDFETVLSLCSGNGDEDIDAVHFLNDDENMILISTLRNCTIDSQAFNNGDVILYNRNTASASLYFDVGEFNNNENVDALTLAVDVTAPVIDHYAIDFPVTPAVTCEALEVDITAHADAVDHSQIATPTNGTVITVTANVATPADVVWQEGTGGNGSLVNGVPGAGQAQYTFNGTETAVELFMRYPNAETNVSVDVDDGTASDTEPTEDPTVDFVLAAFRFLDTSDADIGTQIAGKPSNVAPGLQTLQLRAVQTNTTTLECEAALTGTGIPVDFAYQCNNPATCAISDDGLSFTGAVTQDIDDVGVGYTSINMDFNVGGIAEFSFIYNDVGDISLLAEKTLAANPSANPPTTASTLQGTSAPFVVRPFGFDIDSGGTRAADWGDTTFDCDDANLSCALDATSTTILSKAGDNANTFPVTLRSVLWQSADSDINGLPNPGANLTDNATTPNFGQETITELVDITVGNIQPTNVGSLYFGDDLDFSVNTVISGLSGTLTTDLAFDEVGIIDLTAALNSGDYLSGGFNATATHQNFGRFIPHEFTLADNSPSFENSCVAGGFTYMDESFYYGAGSEPAITVTAVNEAGGTTVNYGDGGTPATDFWKLPTALDRVYDDNGINNASTFNDLAIANVVVTGHDNYDGIGVLTLANLSTDRDSFMFDRSSVNISANEGAPFTASIDLLIQVTATSLTDSDDVCYDGDADGTCEIDGSDDYTALTDTGGTALSLDELRFGRFSIGTDVGSELLPLNPPMVVEYFNGTGFVPNTDDDCTAIDLTDHIRLDNSGTKVQGNAPMAIGSGTTSISTFNNPLSAGDTGTVFSAPGAGNTGFVDIFGNLDCLDVTVACGSATTFNHLLYDWDDDDGGLPGSGDGLINGPYDDNPVGRVDFGVFEGPSNYIYIREPW
jgi:Family of unknown function (DUF6701)